MQPTTYGQYRYAKEVSGAPANLYAQSLLPYPLSDSLTGSETFAPTVFAVFSEMVGASESKADKITQFVTDFIVIKEWVSLRLTHPVTWVNPSANANIFDSLYARNTMGPTVYAGKNILYGGLKPLASWTKNTTRQEAWTNTDGHKYNA